MLTEESVISEIRVDEFGNISVRRSDRVLRDGVVIAETFHRHALDPLAPLDNEAPEVVAVARVVRTKSRVEAARKRRDDNNAEHERVG